MYRSNSHLSNNHGVMASLMRIVSAAYHRSSGVVAFEVTISGWQRWRAHASRKRKAWRSQAWRKARSPSTPSYRGWRHAVSHQTAAPMAYRRGKQLWHLMYHVIMWHIISS